MTVFMAAFLVTIFQDMHPYKIIRFLSRNFFPVDFILVDKSFLTNCMLQTRLAD